MGQGASNIRRAPFDEVQFSGQERSAEEIRAEAVRAAANPAPGPVAAAAAAAAAVPNNAGAPQPAPMAAAPAAAPAAAARPQVVAHKSTAIIPGWSRVLSSQSLTIECQKITQPGRSAQPRELYGVMELEVMKFVAYCGGLTIRLRVDDLNHGPVDSVTWGLAAMRACPALANTSSTSAGGAAAPPGSFNAAPGTPTSTRPGSGAGASPAPAPGGLSSAANKANPNLALSVDNTSRKPLYAICATSTVARLNKRDVLSMDLSPKEDGQPVIMVTLSHNDTVLLRAALPCASIAALQMYPFITVNPGMVVSLHEALTPSPLYTWYSPTSATADIQMADLDTCVKYNTAAAVASSNGLSEFHGSTTFTGGRHRWTVQLDNSGQHAGYIFVGLVHSEPTQPSSSSILAATLPAVLAGRALGAGITPTTPTGAAAAAAAPTAAGASSSTAAAAAATPAAAPPAPVPAVAATPATATPTAVAAVAGAPAPVPGPPARGKWGVWVKLPGLLGPNSLTSSLPPRDGVVQVVESQSNHCCITVDLDLICGYAKFFRNGHLLGQAFTGLTAPISPALAFLQGTHQHLQAGLVNITKLQQLDLEWNTEACSGDLRINSRTVSKVSEVYGDYSTVLCNQGFISGVHLWLVKVNNLSEPDSIFIGVCRGCMPLDQDPQDLRDRTYYLSNGVIRVGGRRVATNAANFTKNDIVGVVLDADQGEIVFLRNGIEQGRARGIRGRLYPFVSFDSEGDQVTLLGSYTLPLNRTPRQLADMEWDTMGRAGDIELSSNCLTATKSASMGHSTVRGTILYNDRGVHEFHVILDNLGPDGVWVGVANPSMDATKCVGDVGCGWALHSDGDRRFDGREEEFTSAFKNGDVLTVGMDLSRGTLRFSRNGIHLGDAFTGVKGPLVAMVTLASEESKVTIQNRPTVLNMGEYTGELRWDEVRAGRDLHVIDGLTVTKMANEGGDYATVLGTLCMASGQHSWNVYINHVEDSNLFIGVTVGGHDLNADPQEMKSRTYYLSNGTIRVAGKLVTRCAEPYAEGDLVTVQLDMEQHHISFYKNGVLQGAGDGLPDEVWPYVSLDNIMDSITLHSSNMFLDLANSLKWSTAKCCAAMKVSPDGSAVSLRTPEDFSEYAGQGTVLGLREYTRTEVHSWVVRLEQQPGTSPANFLVGVAPVDMSLDRSIGEAGCGIALDYYGYIYVNGKYFHVSNLANWQQVAKSCKGSTARHKGKAGPLFQFHEGKCEITVTLDLKEGTLKFSSGGHSIGTIANVRGPLHAALTLTHHRQTAVLLAGPIGKTEHTAEELVNILKAKGHLNNSGVETAMLMVPRDLFVPRDRHREAFRDQKVTIRMSDGSTLTLPPPNFVATALEKLNPAPAAAFLDVGCGSAYVTAVAACMVGPMGTVHGIECLSSRLESARNNLRNLRDRLPAQHLGQALVSNAATSLSRVQLTLTNVLIPECTDGQLYDCIYCDTTLSEEDLPAFLSLLKPMGRMVVVIEDEALLITRSHDPHDFSRESLMKMTPGDFGELEDPTPWEVQEAITRMKTRECQRGLSQAKRELTSLRSNELLDLQQRMAAAMQRIAELECNLQRSSAAAAARPAGADDTRAVIRDTPRSSRQRRTPRMSPRSSLRSPGSEPVFAAPDANVKARLRQLGEDGEDSLAKLDKAGLQEAAERKISTTVYSSYADVVYTLGVQVLSSSLVHSVIKGAAADQVSGYDVFQGTFRGTPVQVWRLTISQPVNTLDVYRCYSRFCASHPHVCSLLGACIESVDGTAPMEEDGAAGDPCSSSSLLPEHLEGGCHLWVVEERHGDLSLARRLEKGMLSWQHVLSIATDTGSALAYLQTLRRLAPTSAAAVAADGGDAHLWDSPAVAAALTPLAVAQMVAPDNCRLTSTGVAKLSLAPSLLCQLESSLGLSQDSQRVAENSQSLFHYVHPSAMFSSSTAAEGTAAAFSAIYSYAVVLLQLLTEQQAPGLLGAVQAAIQSQSLTNLVPRTPPAGDVGLEYELAQLALRCTTQQAAAGSNPLSLDGDVLPLLGQLSRQLESLGPAAMSWEQMEELMMMPLQPWGMGGVDPAARRWVRQDFKMRRKLFLEEVAKVAVEGPIHKIEVRRSRCFKDSVATFSGKGQNVWRQPLKVTFIGEAGMDSGGVTREWFSCICAALSRGHLDLFWAGGPSRSQLYINPLSNSPSHLKRFHFVGTFMAKALVETAARGKELGPIVLNLSFCEPFWKLLLGIPLTLQDLQALDVVEFRSLMQMLQLDIEGLIFETFTWNFQHMRRGTGAKDEPEIPALPSGASPFSGDSSTNVEASISLKPGGSHLKVTNTNKREYVLLKAQKMLMGAIEAQMSSVIDAFYSLVPRELVEKYAFTPLELQLLVCGEQRIDISDLQRHCKYEDGYTGKEEQIAWFWQAVTSMDESQRRALLQFWSGSDGMPAEGFGSLEPAFHLVSVDRMYDRNDKTARLPAAHTCFRQLDLPRYRSYDELREKIITAITMGQGYMALS